MAVAKSTIEDKLDRELASLLKENQTANFPVDFDDDINFGEFLTNKMLMISVIRAGIPISLFELIQHSTPFTDQDWAIILDISSRSLQRYKTSKDHHFKPIHSEKIIEMAEVTKIGLDVFGEMEKLRLWLNTPNFALGNLTPLELLKDSYGKELVIGELVRINYGILV